MGGALSGIRVADFSSFAVGPWAGTLLGALGADVIKVEQPGGDPLRDVMPLKSGHPTTSTTVNLNKRSVQLNLKDPAEHALALNFAAQADILVENYRAGVMERLGLGYEVISARNPRIIYCSSGSFGPRGPMARVGSTDPQGQAFGGTASLNGPPGVKAELHRHRAYIDLSCSYFLVQAALTALYVRERTGFGQQITTAQMYSAIAMQTSRLGEFFATGRAPQPLGSAVPHIVPSEAFLTRDRRWLFLSAVRPAEWAGLCRAVRRPEWIDEPRFASNAARVEHRAELIPLLQAELALAEASGWLARLEAHGVPCTVALEYEDLVHHEHFRANGVLATTELPDGTPLRTPAVPWRFSSLATYQTPAPRPGEHDHEVKAALREGRWPRLEAREPGSGENPTPALPGAGKGPVGPPQGPVSPSAPYEEHNGSLRAPGSGRGTEGPPQEGPAQAGVGSASLAGIRVVDLTEGVAGPYATMCLGDFGADVVKVERPAGDYARLLGPPFVGVDSALFVALNRNKRSLVLDYEEAAERGRLLGLIERADVLVEDLGPRRAAELGLTYEELRQVNPRLVHCSLTALGPVGPWAGKAVSELELQGITGQTHYLGQAEQPPVRLGIDACATSGGQVAYQAVLAGLYHRERSGQGQHADVSQLQAMISASALLFTAFDNPDRWEGFHCLARGEEPDYGYRTADQPLYFGQSYQSEQPWLDLCEFLGLPELASDPRFDTRAKRTPRVSQLKPLLEAGFARFPREVLLRRINELGCIAVPVNDHEALFSHPQVLANQRKLTMQLQDGRRIDTVGIAWELSATPGSIRRPPPLLGEHDVELLAELSEPRRLDLLEAGTAC
jgi:crotonobetainyl-CoA:carnitine CoA-transferase CaiB-like acyl-CoA transferase